MPRKKILLVDDVQLFLEQEKAFLSRTEFELIFARSGNEALRQASRHKPDLILMDYYMPDMNGDRCCLAIKSVESLRDTPVVILTAGLCENDFQKCWDAGCSDIVPKPINRIFFNAVINKHLALPMRQTPRYVARLRVQYGVQQELQLDDYSINVSTGGLFIESSRPLPPDTPLSLAFVLPEEGKTVRCEGRVAWVNHPDMIKNPALPAGMGIQFLNLPLDDLKAIRDFIKKGALLPFWPLQKTDPVPGAESGTTDETFELDHDSRR